APGTSKPTPAGTCTPPGLPKSFLRVAAAPTGNTTGTNRRTIPALAPQTPGSPPSRPASARAQSHANPPHSSPNSETQMPSSPDQNSHPQTASAARPTPQTESSSPLCCVGPTWVPHPWGAKVRFFHSLLRPSPWHAPAWCAQNPRPTLFPSPYAAAQT